MRQFNVYCKPAKKIQKMATRKATVSFAMTETRKVVEKLTISGTNTLRCHC